MGTGPDDQASLASLGERIEKAKAARQPSRSVAGEKYRLSSLAWRMVTDLVVGVLVGGAIGWGLDRLFGTLPVFLIVMGLFGFAAGIKLVMRAAEEMADEAKIDTATPDAPATGPDESGEARR